MCIYIFIVSTRPPKYIGNRLSKQWLLPCLLAFFALNLTTQARIQFNGVLSSYMKIAYYSGLFICLFVYSKHFTLIYVYIYSLSRHSNDASHCVMVFRCWESRICFFSLLHVCLSLVRVRFRYLFLFLFSSDTDKHSTG